MQEVDPHQVIKCIGHLVKSLSNIHNTHISNNSVIVCDIDDSAVIPIYL